MVLCSPVTRGSVNALDIGFQTAGIRRVPKSKRDHQELKLQERGTRTERASSGMAVGSSQVRRHQEHFLQTSPTHRLLQPAPKYSPSDALQFSLNEQSNRTLLPALRANTELATMALADVVEAAVIALVGTLRAILRAGLDAPFRNARGQLGSVKGYLAVAGCLAALVVGPIVL